jgi:hypothetical protein
VRSSQTSKREYHSGKTNPRDFLDQTLHVYLHTMAESRRLSVGLPQPPPPTPPKRPLSPMPPPPQPPVSSLGAGCLAPAAYLPETSPLSSRFKVSPASTPSIPLPISRRPSIVTHRSSAAYPPPHRRQCQSPSRLLHPSPILYPSLLHFSSPHPSPHHVPERRKTPCRLLPLTPTAPWTSLPE